MKVVIADSQLTIPCAAEIVALYAREHSRTLRTYDGRAMSRSRPGTKYTEDDIAAAKVIERRAINSKVASQVVNADLPWNRVPDRNIDLADLDAQSKAYDQLARFYIELRGINGVGAAVASKMMYLRWPGATPIQDSLFVAFYRDAARRKYDDLVREDALPEIVKEQRWRRLFTFAMRDDLLTNRQSGAMDALRDELETSVKNEEHRDLLRVLTDCRLLDVLVWRTATSQTGRARPAARG